MDAVNTLRHGCRFKSQRSLWFLFSHSVIASEIQIQPPTEVRQRLMEARSVTSLLWLTIRGWNYPPYTQYLMVICSALSVCSALFVVSFSEYFTDSSALFSSNLLTTTSVKLPHFGVWPVGCAETILWWKRRDRPVLLFHFTDRFILLVCGSKLILQLRICCHTCSWQLDTWEDWQSNNRLMLLTVWHVCHVTYLQLIKMTNKKLVS